MVYCRKGHTLCIACLLHTLVRDMASKCPVCREDKVVRRPSFIELVQCRNLVESLMGVLHETYEESANEDAELRSLATGKYRRDWKLRCRSAFPFEAGLF